MSQPAAKLLRPRRASRAPGQKLSDENGSSSVAPAVATGKVGLASKASTNGLASKAAAQGLAVKVAAVTAAGKASAQATAPTGQVVNMGPRRALQDVSNATATTRVPDRTSKDSIVTKPVRSRAGSVATTSSAAPAVAAANAKSLRPAASARDLKNKASTATLRPSKAVDRKPSRASLQQAARHAAQQEEMSVDEQPALLPVNKRLAEVHREPAGIPSSSDLDQEASDEEQSDPYEDEMASGEGTSRDADGSLVSEEDEGESNGSGLGPTAVEAHGHADEHDVDIDDDDWVRMVLEENQGEEDIKDKVRKEYEDQVDFFDTSMVAEYAPEIFAYMSALETASMPNPKYMEHQNELEWPMRRTLIDWLLQIHLRYHMLPETLWIAANIIDRFLSKRVVSLLKLQLVGVTAMFVAAKYEEIMAPSVDEFVYMTESGYTRDEILKGERIILSTLEFNISTYCSPYSWVRKISKADDYDIQTRTLSKFLMEVTLHDHRFLRAKPSMIAAVGMYLSRKMLGGDWSDSFIYYSDYTEAELLVPANFLLENIADAEFEGLFVYKKYASKKFLKASLFARNWVAKHWSPAPEQHV